MTTTRKLQRDFVELMEEVENSAYELAILGLRSKRYEMDPEYREAVDRVLFWTYRKENE